jgi:hypothetical protein
MQQQQQPLEIGVLELALLASSPLEPRRQRADREYPKGCNNLTHLCPVPLAAPL